MIAVTLRNSEIGIADVKLRDREAYSFRRIAPDAVLVSRRDSLAKGEPHNAIASLIASTQIYGPAVIVGVNPRELPTRAARYHDAPQRYVEAYEINEQEKQESKEETK